MDLKFENVLYDVSGTMMLTDFGLAAILPEGMSTTTTYPLLFLSVSSPFPLHCLSSASPDPSGCRDACVFVASLLDADSLEDSTKTVGNVAHMAPEVRGHSIT
tara:strand:+ start:335 stop:643 length:309 start_codon:yes stop_codon:yes gene_type:complete